MINQNVVQVSTLAENTQGAANSMQEDSTSLRQLAEGLTEKVSQFHVIDE
jgi:methyl-accepting chemotaxis protein